MEFEQSSLWRDVQRVVRSNKKPVNFVYTATIHTGEGNYVALKVLNIDYEDNFIEAYTSKIHLEVLLPMGTYAKRVLPNKDVLEVTLTRIPVDEIGVGIDTSQPITAIRYKAVLMTIADLQTEDPAGFEVDEQTLNVSNFDRVKFQLIDKTVEQLRMVTTGTVFRYSKVEDCIKTAVENTYSEIVVDGQAAITGIDMVEADNVELRNHVVIPHGTSIMDIPDYVQKKCGVYSNGLSHFVKDKYWYIYPTYDYGRFNNTLRTMNIILVPQNKLPGIERTYLKDGDCLTILCTAERKHTDKTESQQLNQGNGTQFFDAKKILNGAVEIIDNIARMSRGANNSEYVRNARADGFNNVKVSNRPFTANVFEENSKLIEREGSYFQLVWENSNTDLVLPGTMVRIFYLGDTNIEQMEGVIVAAHHYVQLAGQGMSASRYFSNTGMVAFIKKSTK